MFIFSFLMILFSAFHLVELVFVYLIYFFLFISFLYSDTLLSGEFLMDSLSNSMVLLSLILWGLISLCSLKGNEKMMLLISLLFFIILLFFLTTNMMVFFISFELSLVPLLFLIMNFGRQMERVIATQFFLLYTIIASSPLLVFVIFYSSLLGSSMYVNCFSYNFFYSWFVLLSIFSFMVKIPFFLFHSWLLKAHVEAPLEGSMILAGVMLKVGVYGFLRILFIADFSGWLLDLLFCLSLIGSIISALVALSSDDMKMSVAFSSISHMNCLVPSFLCMKMYGLDASIFIMVGHGLLSPLLFFFVTKIYYYSNSRSVIISKGLMSKFPLFSFIGLILWSMNLSTPPFFSFLGEFLIISSLFSFFIESMIFIVVFIFLSSFFSIMNYGIQSHSSYKSSVKTSFYDFLFSLLSVFVFWMMIMLFFFQPFSL